MIVSQAQQWPAAHGTCDCADQQLLWGLVHGLIQPDRASGSDSWIWKHEMGVTGAVKFPPNKELNTPGSR